MTEQGKYNLAEVSKNKKEGKNIKMKTWRRKMRKRKKLSE